jgi:hypothetical protein
MDQEYVQGLRDAKALLDEGIFTQEEFMREKETLFKQREERAVERARLGVSVMPVISDTKVRISLSLSPLFLYFARSLAPSISPACWGTKCARSPQKASSAARSRLSTTHDSASDLP